MVLWPTDIDLPTTGVNVPDTIGRDGHGIVMTNAIALVGVPGPVCHMYMYIYVTKEELCLQLAISRLIECQQKQTLELYWEVSETFKNSHQML